MRRFPKLVRSIVIGFLLASAGLCGKLKIDLEKIPQSTNIIITKIADNDEVPIKNHLQQQGDSELVKNIPSEDIPIICITLEIEENPEGIKSANCQTENIHCSDCQCCNCECEATRGIETIAQAGIAGGAALVSPHAAVGFMCVRMVQFLIEMYKMSEAQVEYNELVLDNLNNK